ncbi:MAG: LrgB family protein, partial [Candidatus Scatosoma sp.]
MKEFLTASSYAALFLTLGAYALGELLKKKTKNALFNPLLIASALIIVYLIASKTSVEEYREQTRMIGGLLTPATVCLAIPLHKQFSLLKRNAPAVICGVCCGILSSLLCTLLLSAAFSLSHAEYVTFLPKSITTAIGMEVSAEY